ncbi:uncharacterized protein LOC112690180 isoform X2 [Sipha flava]|uniref:Uncharacterized protein LOC112690180 isoform X2 n=1 Tax=Sipha flava TaxID=143950 RepID=A0A8B8GAI4_9HEMI|nr:uncharacterized protein LOC112690180 isoform X2 [Sipha flava]
MNDFNMPKFKKNIVNDENDVPNNINVSNEKQRRPYKFDIRKILKERKVYNEYKKKSAELDEQLKVVDDLFQDSIKVFSICNEKQSSPESTKHGYIIFDHSKYNSIFKNNSDSYKSLSNSQKIFIKMSKSKNVSTANVYFKYLMEENWSPVLDDIKNVLCNWGADFDTLANKPLLKCEINNDNKIGQHNFELVMKFITHNVLKTNNGLTDNDLLKLANISVTISFDRYCRRMINVIKQLFCACIEKTLRENDEIAITSFADDLYSKYTKTQLLKMINLFLPLDNYGQTMKIIYKYITFKLLKSLLGISDDKNVFPTLNDWFVQDMVTKDYLHRKPKIILHRIIKLLDHVVVTLDLYKNEEKLECMYHFFYAVIRSAGFFEYMDLINVIDKWKMQLFKLHIDRKRLMIL